MDISLIEVKKEGFFMNKRKKASPNLREGKYASYLPLLEMFLFNTAALYEQEEYIPAFTFCGSFAVQ